jgi:hypothetical protein
MPESLNFETDTVLLAAELRAAGWSRSAVSAQVSARRWRRFGRAVVLHNGLLTHDEQRRVALLNAGRRAVYTAFTAAEIAGLSGWSRPYTSLLVPCGTRVRRTPRVPVRVHHVADWQTVDRRRDMHALAPALIVAASTFEKPRPACGLLAAGVQQRLVTAAELAEALDRARQTRHRAMLRLAVADIAQGSEALSEIDFARLCRLHGLPEPRRQAVRADQNGRKRYLDAEWVRERDRKRVVAEVDGALHLTVERWWEDQARQNEISLDGALVLRFPSIVIRTAEADVASQLRRALG